jgi:hypothetical protein
MATTTTTKIHNRHRKSNHNSCKQPIMTANSHS